MFTVKATYGNETRKFTFPDSVLFPTYQQLHHQLYRIFPISRKCCLSRLIFSPDSLKPGRILVGKEVHSPEEYDSRVVPLRRPWPNPLLRFTILDEPLREVPGPGGPPQRLSLYSAPTIPLSGLTSELPSPVVPHDDGTLPSHTHSSTVLLPALPRSPTTCVVSRSPPTCFPTLSNSFECGAAGTAPCCSITQGKVDIQILLSSFKEDLEGILCRTLGTNYVEQSPAPITKGSACRPSGVDVAPSQTETLISSTNPSSRWCFVCKTSFTGVWYGCVKCPWHAICPSCFSKSHSAHTLSFGPSHLVHQRSADCSTQYSAPSLRENVVLDSVPGTSQSSTPTYSVSAREPAPPVHLGIICDSCGETLVGVRHKCLDCPNYDLCTPCVESGATERHNPFHEFSDIETPGRVYVHTILGNDRDGSPENRRQLSSYRHVPVRPRGPPGTPTDLPVRHPATCNLCDSAIVGERYKCTVCPDFDTCPSCFRITTEQHPNHGFVRVNKPEDLMMRDSITARQVAHLAVCDSCHKTICGARYKCMHASCLDFDLCSDCEALPIPVHPLNHPMLKLRTPDTVVPTVYRIGQTQIVDKPAGQEPAVCGESRSPALPPLNPFGTSTDSPVPRPTVAPEDQTPFAEEFLSPLGSPASEDQGVAPNSATVAPSHLLVDVADPPGSPQSIHTALDIYHQLWPRVNQELIQLNVGETLGVGHLVVDPVEDAIAEPVRLRSLAVEELPPVPPAYQAGECCRTYSASPDPSTRSIVDGYRTPPSVSSNGQGSQCITQSFTSDQQETITADAPQQHCLDLALVGDTNVPNGQIFPPGAEFVKGWHVMNNGDLPWPTTTEVQFVAGEMFAPECSAALKAKIGVVQPGQDLDIWTGDLKAPDVPGRYVGYWRLNDGQGNFFGSSVWIDLTVVDHYSDRASEQSLAASSMVMPSAHPGTSADASDGLRDAPHPSLPSTKTVTDEVEGVESDISSVSLVSVPTSEDEDAEWQDTRTHSEPLEYVVLYDSSSEE